jgi:hypothetical protein
MEGNVFGIPHGIEPHISHSGTKFKQFFDIDFGLTYVEIVQVHIMP